MLSDDGICFYFNMRDQFTVIIGFRVWFQHHI